jgi:hypothetical protein
MCLRVFQQIAHPHLSPEILPARWFAGAPLSLEMLRKGKAKVYEGENVDYGQWGKKHFLKLEKKAK